MRDVFRGESLNLSCLASPSTPVVQEGSVIPIFQAGFGWFVLSDHTEEPKSLQTSCERSISAGQLSGKHFSSLASISHSGSEIPFSGEQLAGTTSNCLP